MTAKTKVALVGALVLVGALGLLAMHPGTRQATTARSRPTRERASVAAQPEEPGTLAPAAESAPSPLSESTAHVDSVPAGTILGHILGPDGMPAKGAQVQIGGWLTREDGSTISGGAPYEVSRTTNVDDEGFYRFEGLSPGCYRLRAECEGLAPRNSEYGHVLTAKSGAEWSTRLCNGGTVVVVLEDSANGPLPGAEIEISKDERAATDASGRAVFAHLAAGPRPVIARHGGDAESRIVTVLDGQTTTVTFVVGAVLHGLVTSEDGEPVRNRSMRACLDSPTGAQLADGSTDATGRYEFRWLGPGEWGVQMGYRGVWSESRPIHIDDEPIASLDVRLRRPAIAGRLVPARLSSGMVWLFHADRRAVGSIAVADDGTFGFYDLSPGGYVLSMQPASGYAPCEMPVQVESGQLLGGLEIAVAEVQYGDVELEISDSEGALTESVQMFVSDPPNRMYRNSTSAAPAPASPGRFRLTLPRGKHVITICRKKKEVRVDVDVEEGKTVYKTVEIPP